MNLAMNKYQQIWSKYKQISTNIKYETNINKYNQHISPHMNKYEQISIRLKIWNNMRINMKYKKQYHGQQYGSNMNTISITNINKYQQISPHMNKYEQI